MQNSKKFGLKGYLYVLPWLAMLFVSTFSWNSLNQFGIEQQQSFYGKLLIIFTLSVSLLLLFFRYQSVFVLVRGRWAYVLFMFYITASTAWSSDPMSTLRMSAYYWGVMVLSLAAITALRENSKKFFEMLIFYSALMILGSLAVSILIPARGVADGGRWMGLTIHPNQLGIVAIITVWSNFSYFFMTRSKIMKLINLSLIAVAAICLYGANSATSIVLAAVIIVLTLILRSLDTKNPRTVVLQLLSLGFVVIVGVLAIYVIKPKLLGLDTVLGAVGRNATFTGRTALWAMGMSKFYQAPIMGSGFQEFINVTGEEIKHFHNGYLELVIRGGAVAAVFLAVFVFQFFLSLKRIANLDLYIFFAIMMFSTLVHNVTESSFGHGMSALWLIFTILYFYKGNHGKAKQRTSMRSMPVKDTTIGVGNPRPAPRLGANSAGRISGGPDRANNR